MAIKTFKKTYTEDKDLNAVQSNIQVTFDQITSYLPLSGVKISAVSVATMSTPINHKLGYQPVGFIITDQTAPGSVYRIAWDSRTITLKSSSNTVVDIWVF